MKETFNITAYCLKQHAQASPHKIALILVDKLGVEKKISYSALYRDVCQLTTGLNSLNISKGTIVSICATDVYDVLLLFLSTIAANLVPILLLNSLSVDEFNFILRDSDTRVFFHLNNITDHIHIPAHCRLIQLDEYKLLKEFPYQDISPQTLFNDPAFIFYTSGSRGKPKGVMHAQRVILGRSLSLHDWLHLRSDDIVLQTDNICWTYSIFTGFLDPLSIGATALIFTPSNQSSIAEDTISGDQWFQLIDYYHVTVIASTPDIFSILLNAKNIKDYQHTSLRMAGSAGAILSERTQEKWQAIFHWPIYTALGMSELSTFISTGDFVPYRPQTLGKIQPGRKVCILPLDEGFETVPVNEIGMLAIHKDELGFMLQYVGESKNDTHKFRGDWFLTQDLVSMDSDQYIHYYGRADSILKIGGGFRVSPIEIENVFNKLEEVKAAACGIIFDENTASDLLVVYLIVDNPDKHTIEKIDAYMRKHLSDYKIPSYLYIVEQLPYSNRQKLMRDKLKSLHPILVYDCIAKVINIA